MLTLFFFIHQNFQRSINIKLVSAAFSKLELVGKNDNHNLSRNRIY